MKQNDIVIEVTKIANRPVPKEHVEYYLCVWKAFGLGKEYGKTSKLEELIRQKRIIGAFDK